jgi:undecaprenyl-diphosphatase
MRRWQPPPWLALWMLASTRLGDGWAWAAVILAGLARGHTMGWALSETATAIVVVNTAQVGLKHAFRRSRPSTPAVSPRVSAPDRFSFPSGHTMNAFAVAVLVAIDLPAAAPLAVAIACSVGASRVVFRLHYASDVVVGAALGGLLAAAVAVLALP